MEAERECQRGGSEGVESEGENKRGQVGGVEAKGAESEGENQRRPSQRGRCRGGGVGRVKLGGGVRGGE